MSYGPALTYTFSWSILSKVDNWVDRDYADYATRVCLAYILLISLRECRFTTFIVKREFRTVSATKKIFIVM